MKLVLASLVLVLLVALSIQTVTEIQSQLITANKEYQNTVESLEQCVKEHNAIKRKLEVAEQNISELQQEIAIYKQQIEKLTMENRQFKQNAIRKSITFDQLMEFLERDKTDQHMYISSDVDETNFFECVQFTYTLLRNAYKEGIFACPVVIYFPDELSHMIIAFNTTDEGWVFIEPQTDEIINLSIGKRYYSGFRDWDDTIIRYETCFETREV